MHPDRERSNTTEANKVEVNKVDPCDRQTNLEKSENFRKILKIYYRLMDYTYLKHEINRTGTV